MVERLGHLSMLRGRTRSGNPHIQAAGPPKRSLQMQLYGDIVARSTTWMADRDRRWPQGAGTAE
jgi:hypothetical protein